jgi:hypothetical protein
LSQAALTVLPFRPPILDCDIVALEITRVT